MRHELRFGLLLGLVGCAEAVERDVAGATAPDDAFRIDLSAVDVAYDLAPGSGLVGGRATLRFRLRPGQRQPLFHFDPFTSDRTTLEALSSVELDGDLVPVRELREITFDGSPEPAFVVPRDLDNGEHVLVVDFELDEGSDEPGWFRTTVDDTVGLGNEILWPTINAPGEVARHTVAIRVDADEPYVGVGSNGLVRTEEDGLQIFALDTEREVASYTVMFAVAPAREVTLEAFDVDGIPVRLMSTQAPARNERARRVTTRTLRALEADFGPYPTASLDILLLDWDDGMEYLGATTTGIDALSHELAHLYWGTSAVNATWRDTWLDEALAVWWDEGASPVRDGFRSGMVAGWAEIEPGFDQRGYTRGAEMMASIEEELGRPQFVDFLAALHAERAFDPFTTRELTEDLVAYTQDDRWTATFEDWVHHPRGCATSQGAGAPALLVLLLLRRVRSRSISAGTRSGTGRARSRSPSRRRRRGSSGR